MQICSSAPFSDKLMSNACTKLDKEEIMLNVETIVKESSIIYQFGETLGIKTQDFKIRMPRKVKPFTANYHCVHVRVCQQGAWGGGYQSLAKHFNLSILLRVKAQFYAFFGHEKNKTCQ